LLAAGHLLLAAGIGHPANTFLSYSINLKVFHTEADSGVGFSENREQTTEDRW
jgi:hypothetical protein